MIHAHGLENETIFGCTQVLIYLEQAQLAADQLGDKASVALIETLQRLYRIRAGAHGELGAALGPASQRAAPVESLDVYLFGAARVFLGGNPVDGWRKKSEALFKYLIVHRAIPVHRDQLLDLFWPEADPQAARNCLNVTLHALRRTLEASGSAAACKLIHFANDHYSFHPALEVWTDVDAFNGHLAKGQAALRGGDRRGAIAHYELAATLYTGDFLEGDRYEDWTINPRERLRIGYLALLTDLARLYAEAGNHTAALECSRKILDLDDCYEDAQRQMMHSYCALGQRGLALRQYQICRETLDRELGVAPMSETTSLYEQIKDGSYAAP